MEGLNGWDALIEDARVRRDRGVDVEGLGGGDGRALHALGAEELYQAHLSGWLGMAGRELEEKLEKQRKQNETAMEGIRGQREEMERLVSGLEGLVRDIEGSATAIDGVEGLRGDVWEMEQEVKATR